MNDNKNKSISYKDAGVDKEHGYELVSRLKKSTAQTSRKGVMGGLGGFGALFDLGSLNYKHPILVSGTDGVGTKIKLAIDYNRHETIGIDLVAMCVNDLVVQGADPLFFLDYFACSKLDVDVAEIVINGIVKGCSLAGCSLIGGETAEMPGMYQAGEYDLAGFSVGVVEKDDLITGETVQEGDVLIGIASSGFHSNGYSLIRKIISDHAIDLSKELNGRNLLDQIIVPTRIYVKSILNLQKNVSIKSIAHITGGGLIENLPRVIPDNLCAKINTESWKVPDLFNWIRDLGNITQTEMLGTFNCGIGMVVCVPANRKSDAIESLEAMNERCWQIGEIIKNTNNSKIEFC